MSKVCSKCKEEKPLSEYHKDKTKKSGLASQCKTCVSARNKVKYRAKAEREGRTVITIRVSDKEGYKVCSACDVDKPIGEYYTHKRGKYGVRSKCKLCDGDRLRRNNLRVYHKKMREDPCYRIRKNVSSAVRSALFRSNGSKEGESVLKHLPYTIEELKEHIESQFKDDMSWENYGTSWHIDHIYPQSRLPYDTMSHPNFRRAWALDNLRPLDAIENIRKGARIEGDGGPDEMGD